MKVFIDVNIFMYAAGSSHPHQEPSKRLLERIGHGDLEAVSDTETLQELLYRFWHLKQVSHGVALVHQVVRIVPTLLPIEKADVVLAARLLTAHAGLEPRDAIHAAAMLNRGITHLYSYDRHFDAIPGLTRLEP